MRKLMVTISIGAAAFANDWDLEAPTGLKFGLIKGYENWHVVATHFRTDKNELRYIIGNDVAVKAYRSGVPLNGKEFPEGAILVKIGYSLKKNPAFEASLEPDVIQRVEYMIKDSKRFKDSGGWGFARFVYDAKDGKYKVFGKSAEDYVQCFTCHKLVEKKDFVFTDYVNRK
ncbi:cytochrome P460 [Hydrogenivirga caldilitoris]|uniref:Cytochrome P460 n=1 Tax=Hydrogenivirga caldilitoris TaxID=246264 RepID=A0A497XM68_9AQUI|nr:cytochrome P460 family protein [Hydrogenivirga caldilitoris]RLJ69888.1 cytochrome P460 [Hydrogenivirga caldilitoris]